MHESEVMVAKSYSRKYSSRIPPLSRGLVKQTYTPDSAHIKWGNDMHQQTNVDIFSLFTDSNDLYEL